MAKKNKKKNKDKAEITATIITYEQALEVAEFANDLLAEQGLSRQVCAQILRKAADSFLL